jgi:hypothetical protein
VEQCARKKIMKMLQILTVFVGLYPQIGAKIENSGSATTHSRSSSVKLRLDFSH